MGICPFSDGDISTIGVAAIRRGEDDSLALGIVGHLS
jgi:hypothetical protein